MTSPEERTELLRLAVSTFEPNRDLLDGRDAYWREVQLAGWLETFEADRRFAAWQRNHGAAA